MQRAFLSGNEAIARGLYEADCHLATAFPGSPATEILDTVIRDHGERIVCHWASNEKTAFEIAAGAAIGGARAFVAMKHVGVNVAAAPIFSMSYEGVRGGLVFVSCDDPGCYASQDEQDNRVFAPFAKVAMLEPSTAEECRDFTRAAFDLSEKYDTLVMVRVTNRICHTKGPVELREQMEHPEVPYIRNAQKFAMLPANARIRHTVREELLKKLERYSNNCRFNRIEYGEDESIGVITSGAAYLYAKEVFGERANYLKLGLTHPLPRQLIREFASSVKTLYVIEELEPYIETVVRAEGFTNCIGKSRLPLTGELNSDILRTALGFAQPVPTPLEQSFPRQPQLCAGCPHRGFFTALAKELDDVVPVGDIGCCVLGSNAPQNALDVCICMGSALSATVGLAAALRLQGDGRKPLAITGDTAFFHSGIPALMDVITADANVICCILDNGASALTGGQPNAGTGFDAVGKARTAVNLEQLLLGLGISGERIAAVDPLDVQGLRRAIQRGVKCEGLFVMLLKRPCPRLTNEAYQPCRVDTERCRGCKTCLTTACPALRFEKGKARIAPLGGCIGCGLCASLCKFGAIRKEGENA